MTKDSKEKLLMAYRAVCVAQMTSVAELLEAVILDEMGGEEPPMVTIGNDKVTFEPYKAVTTPLCVPMAESVDVTADWTAIDYSTGRVTS